MSKLSDGSLLPLLPASIGDDPQMRAAAEALAPALKALSLSIPNLLIFSRLGKQAPGRMVPPLARLTEARGGLKPLSLEEVEQLAWQFHVDFRDAAASREQLAAMTINAIPWHRIKGTPASLKAALGLFGYGTSSAQDAGPSGIIIEEPGPGPYWATYQLGLPQIADVATVRHIVSICNEMAPARCRLWRIYTDVFDRRPIIPSVGPALGDGWLSFHSGTPVPVEPDASGSDDVLVSFGVRNGFQCEPYGVQGGSFGVVATMGVLVPYLDRFVVGRSRLGEVYPRNHGFAVTSRFSILWAERATLPRRWEGEWDERRWRDYTGYDRRLPRWSMGWRSFSRNQLVLGDAAPLGDINARLGVTRATDILNPPRVGEARLSDHDPRRRILRLHEMFIDVTGLQIPPVNPGPPQTGGAALLAARALQADPARGRSAGHSKMALRVAARQADAPRAAGSQLLSATLPEPVNPGPPQVGSTALLSARAPRADPARGRSAGHSDMALRMAARQADVPRAAGSQLLSATLAAPIARRPPLLGVRTYRRATWADGTWDQRAWAAEIPLSRS